MFLKLARRRCLVVGAGTVAESKIAGLLDTGALITVVAPQATPNVRSWAGSGKIAWRERPFEPSDLDDVFLVVAATSWTELHQQIFREATQRGVLCNIVDVPELCDFYYPAVVQRGALQIAISTEGNSPALAQRLRKELEAQFGPEWEYWVEHLAAERDKVLAEITDPEHRKQLLHGYASDESFQAFRRKRDKSKPGSKPARSRR
jgi:precorrin-2 dehydrogenase/sirohydrochlorin ferrochelatase